MQGRRTSGFELGVKGRGTSRFVLDEQGEALGGGIFGYRDARV